MTRKCLTLEERLEALEQKQVNQKKKQSKITTQNKELKRLKKELDTLKQSNVRIKEKIQTSADTIRSVKDLTKEFQQFFSIKGYSEILRTRSLFRKIFWLIYFASFLTGCMLFVAENIRGYLANGVVTNIQVMDDETIAFPAVTFCLVKLNYAEHTNHISVVSHNYNLRDFIYFCYFETSNYPCRPDDFEHVPIFSGPFFSTTYDCYKFNGGRNAKNQESDILRATRVGVTSGLNIFFNLTQFNSDLLYFHVDDNGVKPIFTVLNHIAQQNAGKLVNVEIKKTIDTKVPKPYSNCTESINPDTSHLVKEIFEKNVTYRQKYCYEMCYNDYLNSFAESRNISKIEAYPLLTFDYKGNCSHLCPLECCSVSFEVFKSESSLNVSLLYMNFYYSDRKYTLFSQSRKTTESDIISSTGGVLGLFLELTFISAYRFFSFIIDVYFERVLV